MYCFVCFPNIIFSFFLQRFDDDLEITEFLHTRITRLDHFNLIVELIQKALKEKHNLEEQFKKSCFGQTVYGVQGLTWSIQLIHSLLLRVMKIREKDKEGSMYFKLCGEQFKFGNEEFALITGLKFGNSKAENKCLRDANPICQVLL